MQIIYLHRTSLEDGAGEEIRTPDLRITNALLYQLSYTGLPCFSRHLTLSSSAEESNYEQALQFKQVEFTICNIWSFLSEPTLSMTFVS